MFYDLLSSNYRFTLVWISIKNVRIVQSLFSLLHCFQIIPMSGGRPVLLPSVSAWQCFGSF